MIVLDTNVLSEPLRPRPATQVVHWLDAQHLETLYVTTLTLADLRYGVAALPQGRRRRGLVAQVEEVVGLFEGRVLSFDEPASREYAAMQAAVRSAGQPMPPVDGLIAAICRAHRFTLATRNVRDFAHCGVDVIDPWSAAT